MWIQNISRSAIKNGTHKTPDENTILIQIANPNDAFPIPKFKFSEVYKFKFWDSEDENIEEIFSDEQADQISRIIQDAVKNRKSVIVHCDAGICRSGAVCEAGVIFGLHDTGSYRIPNLLVKRKLLEAFGFIGYD